MVINHWALITYFKSRKLDFYKLDLKTEHCYLLFALVHYTSRIGLKKIRYSDLIYTYISNEFLLKNLPLLQVSKRTLQKRLQKLEDYGLILRIQDYYDRRYIHINHKLMNLLNKDILGISPITNAKKYYKKEFKLIYSKYLDLFPPKKLDELIEIFDNSEHMYQYTNSITKSSKEVLDSLDNYLNKCLEDSDGKK